MSRLLNEPEAWRAVAERLTIDGRSDDGFLCLEIKKIKLPSHISQRMRERVRSHLGGETCAYNDFPYLIEEERESRVIAALWLALEAENESRRVPPSEGTEP